MDPLIAIFVIILVLIVGGFIVLFPLTRRLGKALELYLEQKREEPPDRREVERLRASVRSLQREVGELSDKQEFVERLIQERQRGSLPPDDTAAEGR